MKYILSRNATEPLISDMEAKEGRHTYEFMGKEFPAVLVHEKWVNSDGLKFNRKCELIVDAMEHGMILTSRAVKKLYKAEHKGKTEEFYGKFKKTGDLKCPSTCLPLTVSALQSAFEEDKRFHGRSPRILNSMAAAADYYGISTSTIVDRFSIPAVQALLAGGNSEIETVLLYTQLDAEYLDALINSPRNGYRVAKLLEKELQAPDKGYKNAALWICSHLQSDASLIKKVFKNAEDINLQPDSSVDFADTQVKNLKSLDEVARVEKRYKDCHFKFKNCECQLKMTTVENDRYRAEILKADDPRQVTIGYDTCCCQHLDGIGESSMMHGLLHPKAGFWVITNKNSGKILAQAEVWEWNEKTLVFDNIEFANDAEIGLYREIIGKWLQESEYETVLMGRGYNELTFPGERIYTCNSRTVVPPVTAYEIYVISHEEESEAPVFDNVAEAREALENGRVTYFDYVYCDSEHEDGVIFLKEDGRTEPYFSTEEEKERDE